MFSFITKTKQGERCWKKQAHCGSAQWWRGTGSGNSALSTRGSVEVMAAVMGKDPGSPGNRLTGSYLFRSLAVDFLSLDNVCCEKDSKCFILKNKQILSPVDCE